MLFYLAKKLLDNSTGMPKDKKFKYLLYKTNSNNVLFFAQ